MQHPRWLYALATLVWLAIPATLVSYVLVRR